MRRRIPHLVHRLQRLVERHIEKPRVIPLIGNHKGLPAVRRQIPARHHRPRPHHRFPPPQHRHPPVRARRHTQMRPPLRRRRIMLLPRPHRHRRHPLACQPHRLPRRPTIPTPEKSRRLTPRIHHLRIPQIIRHHFPTQRRRPHSVKIPRKLQLLPHPPTIPAAPHPTPIPITSPASPQHHLRIPWMQRHTPHRHRLSTQPIIRIHPRPATILTPPQSTRRRPNYHHPRIRPRHHHPAHPVTTRPLRHRNLRHFPCLRPRPQLQRRYPAMIVRPRILRQRTHKQPRIQLHRRLPVLQRS